MSQLSQSLIITWTAPTPNPSCGYSTVYRANGNPFYTSINTSGNTSGGTISIPSLAPACYEGYVDSNCCNGNVSVNSPFGVNAYQPIFVNLTWIGGFNYTIYISTYYPNPYDVRVSGFFTSTSGTTHYDGVLPAGTTTISITIGGSGGPVSSYTQARADYYFDNGGALQQYDSVSTPQYFQFYNTSGCTSGQTSGCVSPSWNGSPLTLPSFILRAFNVTTVDTNGNALAGNLLISWIQDYVYNGGTGIYSGIIFRVLDDDDDSVMGTITVPFGQPGLNTATIPLTRTSQPLATTSDFTMTSQWLDDSASGSALFFLPDF